MNYTVVKGKTTQDTILVAEVRRFCKRFFLIIKVKSDEPLLQHIKSENFKYIFSNIFSMYMGIQVDNADAICSDCRKDIAHGSLTIEVGECLMVSASVSGTLFSECQKHHNSKRQWGKPDSPRHDTFTIKRDGKEIGEFRAPSMVSCVTMTIYDQNIQRLLNEEAHEIKSRLGIW